MSNPDCAKSSCNARFIGPFDTEFIFFSAFIVFAAFFVRDLCKIIASLEDSYLTRPPVTKATYYSIGAFWMLSLWIWLRVKGYGFEMCI